MNCAAIHRGLGVVFSSVRSQSMDSWNDKQLKLMTLGGNKNMNEFFADYDLMGESLHQKYKTKAADYYRQKVSSNILMMWDS